MLQTTQILQGRYQLQRQLGNNAGRQTWLAKDIKASPAEPVTVKLLAFSPQMQWDDFKLFEREASVLKQLNHPRIPKYRDYFSLDKQAGGGLCWFGLVQDYIPGYSLQQILDSGKRLKEAQVRSLATQVLEILTYLHELNPPVLHRDIKPSNLILGKDKQVYLVDFGAVQDTAAVEGVTFTVVGTTGYAPLEQFWGKAVAASDLYALGATLIHLLTGIPPADLPQRNLRIQFKEQVSINPAFLSWIEALTEPDLNLRLRTATQALEALKTGCFISYPLQTIQPPFTTRIQLKKSPKQLSIKLPVNASFIVMNIISFLGQRLLLIGLGITLILAVAFLGLLIFSFFVVVSFYSGSVFSVFTLLVPLVILVFYAPVLFVLGWLVKAGIKQVSKIRNNLVQTQLPAFANYFIYLDIINLDIEQFLIERQCLIFSPLIQKGRTSDISEIVLHPQTQTIILIAGNKSYYLGKNSTEAERKWLVQEIQEWLAEVEC